MTRKPSASFLDRPLPVFVRILLLLLCASIPAAYLVRQYHDRPDLTQLLYFGQNYQSVELPEIQRLQPATLSEDGFDAQFYAQIALDPTLRRPDLPPALDAPAFRCERIFLPALAHLLGHGKPGAILFAYALLNPAFWLLLLVAVAWRLPATTPRAFLALYAIMLTTGTLVSIERALTDLPAATLGFLSLDVGETSAAILIALAILTKPTGGLFLLRYLSPFPFSISQVTRKALVILLALLVPILWHLYLRHAISGPILDDNQFDWLLQGWLNQFGICWHTFAADHLTLGNLLSPGLDLLNVLALVSIAVQALFLLFRPRWRNPLWLVGIGFAGLLACLSHNVYVEQIDYTRTVLPLTIAFNFLLLEIRSTPLFLFLFTAGNLGLVGSLIDMLIATWS